MRVRRALLQALAITAAATVLVWAPLPAIPGACVTLKNVVVIFASVVALGVLLYDTFFMPRHRW